MSRWTTGYILAGLRPGGDGNQLGCLQDRRGVGGDALVGSGYFFGDLEAIHLS